MQCIFKFLPKIQSWVPKCCWF